jgi:hypothetical protein
MILRSAFWLVVGFALVAPHGTNLGETATQVKDQAIAAGSAAVTQMIVSQVFSDPVVQKTVAGKLTRTPSVTLPMQDSTTPAYVFPRPRPAAMG